MSHTLTMVDSKGREWIALHNGDWSGNVCLRRLEKGAIKEEHTIPGAIVREMCVTLLKEDVVDLINQWALRQ